MINFIHNNILYERGYLSCGRHSALINDINKKYYNRIYNRGADKIAKGAHMLWINFPMYFLSLVINSLSFALKKIIKNFLKQHLSFAHLMSRILVLHLIIKIQIS